MADLAITPRPNARGRTRFYLDGRERGYDTQLKAEQARATRLAERKRRSDRFVPAAPALADEFLAPVGGVHRHDWPTLDGEAWWFRPAGSIRWYGPYTFEGQAIAQQTLLREAQP